MKSVVILYLSILIFISCESNHQREVYSQAEIDNALEFIIGNRVDDFTGKRTIVTKSMSPVEKFGTGESLTVYGMIYDGSCFLNIRIEDLDERLSINEHDELWFKTNAGEIVKLSFQFNEHTKRSYDRLSISNSVFLINGTLKKLEDTEISKIRISTSHGNMDFDINENKKNFLRPIMQSLLVLKNTQFKNE